MVFKFWAAPVWHPDVLRFQHGMVGTSCGRCLDVGSALGKEPGLGEVPKKLLNPIAQ